MRLMWLLATRNWSSSPGRSLAAVLSVALGVAVVVTVTSFHETAVRTLREQVVDRWLGTAHILIHPPDAHWGALDARVADRIRPLDNVSRVTIRLSRRVRVAPPVDAQRLISSDWGRAQAIGIDPEAASDVALTSLTGRNIEPGDRNVVVMERATAAEFGVALGSALRIAKSVGGEPLELTVIGLFDMERIAEFQADILYLPLVDLQKYFDEPGVVSAIQVTLTDPSADSIDAAKRSIESVVATLPDSFAYLIETAKARQTLLDEAEKITKALMVMIAFIALLTAFFIIVTTMSMSLFERQTQLGILRCVGTTRRQLAAMILLEMIPLGVVGTGLGLLLGYGLTESASYVIAGRSGAVLSSLWGVKLAVASGLLTVLVSAALLIGQVCRVPPLAAVRTYAHAARRSYPYLAAGAGVALLIGHESYVAMSDQTRWLDPRFSFPGVFSLYLGYILLVPMLVVLIGRPMARLVGPLLGLSAKLAEDQFGKSPWRGTGVCWVLMVGLSLTVYIGIGSEAVFAIWDFPARLPEGFVWSHEYVPGSTLSRVKQVPGVRDVTITTDMACEIDQEDTASKSATQSLMKMFTKKLRRPVFVAADPEQIMSVIKVAFLEGTYEEAIEKLHRGGYVLIPLQTSRNKNLHLGDRVTVTISGTTAEFEIAGVIQSPAMDIAVTAFQATSYMQIAAASAMLGTQQDLRDKFGVDLISMFMFNLDLPEAAVPAEFDPNRMPPWDDRKAVVDAMLAWGGSLPNEAKQFERIAPALRRWRESGGSQPLPADVGRDVVRYGKAFQRVHSKREALTKEEAWSMLRGRLVMLQVAEVINRPDAILGSLRRLKTQLEHGLKAATAVVTFLPTILLVVAAVGIANLMMVNVQIRARQLAVLRAVGAVKSQVVRLVLAEAIALALIGSVAGLALGIHEAWTDNRVSAALLGFKPEFIIPYGTVAIGVAITVCVCLVAGIGPARYAARNNIIEAMQVT